MGSDSVQMVQTKIAVSIYNCLSCCAVVAIKYKSISYTTMCTALINEVEVIFGSFYVKNIYIAFFS